jgi:hypothetical protein
MYLSVMEYQDGVCSSKPSPSAFRVVSADLAQDLRPVKAVVFSVFRSALRAVNCRQRSDRTAFWRGGSSVTLPSSNEKRASLE